MIFCHTYAFLVGVKSSLDEFARVFSLVINLEKSHIFLSRVSEGGLSANLVYSRLPSRCYSHPVFRDAFSD